MTHCVGLDVSMEETSICVIDLAGAALPQKEHEAINV